MTIGEVLRVIAEPLQRILNLIPKGINVATTFGGIAWTFGKPYVINPGQIYWYLPAVTEIETFSICRQTLPLNAQGLYTKDNKNIGLSTVVVFSIQNIMKAGTVTDDLPGTIEDLAQCAVKRVVCCKTIDELRDESGEIDNELRKEMIIKLKPFGLKVESVCIQSLVKTNVITHMGIPETLNLLSNN